MKKIPRDQNAHFWSKIKKGDANDCWEWQRARHPLGYGSTYWQGKSRAAHRVAYAITHNDEFPPSHLFVMHTCDNPPCCNPAHLKLGTPRENNIDCIRKKRNKQGENHHLAKLTDAQVQLAIGLYHHTDLKYSDIAAIFGVTRGAICHYVSGHSRSGKSKAPELATP